MIEHEVSPGESLATIGGQYGFSWKTLWNHPRNATLRALRKDPNVLHPGDLVYIPDMDARYHRAGTNQRHRYVRNGVLVKLRLRILRHGKALAQTPYTLEIEGKLIQGKTDSNGRLEHQISPASRKGVLMLQDGHESYPLKIGHLDPVDETTGIQARLHNLGFYRGQVDGIFGPLTRAAVRSFQNKLGLSETGEPDVTTRNALRAEHES